jgi:hypothetical protein
MERMDNGRKEGNGQREEGKGRERKDKGLLEGSSE